MRLGLSLLCASLLLVGLQLVSAGSARRACEWTKKVAPEKQLECCSKSARANEQKDEKEKEEADEKIETLIMQVQCFVGLVDQLTTVDEDGFPPICCKLKPFKARCEKMGIKDKPTRMRYIARRSFRRYEAEQLLTNQDSCQGDPVVCCPKDKADWSVSRRSGTALIDPQARLKRRFLFSEDFLIHVIMCSEALILNAISLKPDLPEICCSLPVVGWFCKKKPKPTRKPTTTTSKPSTHPETMSTTSQTPVIKKSTTTANPMIATTTTTTTTQEPRTTVKTTSTSTKEPSVTTVVPTFVSNTDKPIKRKRVPKEDINLDTKDKHSRKPKLKSTKSPKKEGQQSIDKSEPKQKDTKNKKVKKKDDDNGEDEDEYGDYNKAEDKLNEDGDDKKNDEDDY